MVHDTLAEAAFRVAQAHDRAWTDLTSGDAAGIGEGVSLSHGFGRMRALTSRRLYAG
jgi:hypothetical protein